MPTMEYIFGRCMGNELMQAEYPDQNQKVAVCLSAYRQGGRKGAKDE